MKKTNVKEYNNVSKREGKMPFGRPRRRWNEMLIGYNQRGQEGGGFSLLTIQSTGVIVSIR
jgi:hypothetical protein